MLALIAAVGAINLCLMPPRLGKPDWGWRIAADPMPVEMNTAAGRFAWHAQWRAIRSGATDEKIVLVGLICVVYGRLRREGGDVDAYATFLFLSLNQPHHDPARQAPPRACHSRYR